MERRDFLKILGGGTLVSAAIAGGVGGFAVTRDPREALAPWNEAGQYDDPRWRALSYAILSPNPHNRQPWLVDLSSPEAIRIYRDKAKDLPETDPFDRQLTIGMGCFLETLSIAATDTGHVADMRYFPEGEEGAVASAQLREGAEKNPLFRQILQRRSCKEPFSDRVLSEEQIRVLSQFGRVFHEKEDVQTMKDITIRAFDIEYKTPRTLLESVDLMRIGKSEINAMPDGIDLGGVFPESMNLLGVLTRETLMDPSSTAYSQGLEIYHDMLRRTPAYIVLKTEANDRLSQIEAGRIWARLNLTATEMGLALHPVSQALQEYIEMRPLYDEIHAGFAKSGERIQMLGRLGYGPEVPPSPRWRLARKVI